MCLNIEKKVLSTFCDSIITLIYRHICVCIYTFYMFVSLNCDIQVVRWQHYTTIYYMYFMLLFLAFYFSGSLTVKDEIFLSIFDLSTSYKMIAKLYNSSSNYWFVSKLVSILYCTCHVEVLLSNSKECTKGGYSGWFNKLKVILLTKYLNLIHFNWYIFYLVFRLSCNAVLGYIHR